MNWLEWTSQQMRLSDEERTAQYNLRKVARLEEEDNCGMGVSTAWVEDFQCFETAILNFAEGAVPVERYTTREAALEGHERWVQFVTDPKRQSKCVLRLGTPEEIPEFMQVRDREVILYYEQPDDIPRD